MRRSETKDERPDPRHDRGKERAHTVRGQKCRHGDTVLTAKDLRVGGIIGPSFLDLTLDKTIGCACRRNNRNLGPAQEQLLQLETVAAALARPFRLLLVTAGNLVPTLCVGMPSPTLCVPNPVAEPRSGKTSIPTQSVGTRSRRRCYTAYRFSLY